MGPDRRLIKLPSVGQRASVIGQTARGPQHEAGETPSLRKELKRLKRCRFPTVGNTEVLMEI